MLFKPSIFSDWTTQGSFKSPTSIYSFNQNSVSNTSSFGDFNQSKSFSFKIKVKVLGAVSSLLFHSCPHTIFFGVRALVVHTLNRGVFLTVLLYMSLKRLPHVVTELLKSSPIECNSLPTVVMKSRIFRICTSLTNMLKTMIKLEFKRAFNRLLPNTEAMFNHSYILTSSF